MSEELIIDNEITRWVPALQSVRNNEIPKCPICGSRNTSVEKNFENGIGFVLITCGDCKKSGYFSRVSDLK